MFISNNFNRNSSFNYKNSGNKLIRFGCDEKGPCESIKKSREILEANNVDPKKEELYFKYILLYNKRNGVAHEDVADGLLEIIESDPKGSAEKINHNFDTKIAEEYIKLNEVDPLDKAKKLLTDEKATPKKANVLVDTLFRLFHKVLEIPYEKSANMVLDLVKANSKEWKKALSTATIKEIPERFIITSNKEQLKKRIKDLTIENANKGTKKTVEYIALTLNGRTDEEYIKETLKLSMSEMLQEYKVKPANMEIFIGQVFDIAEKEDVPASEAANNLLATTQEDPQTIAMIINTDPIINDLYQRERQNAFKHHK